MLYDRRNRKRLTPEQRELVENNLALVKWFLGQHSGFVKALGYDDAFQTGCLGLMKAARNYDPSRGKFSTIASLEIHNSLAYIMRKDGAIKRTPPGGPVLSLNARVTPKGSTHNQIELQDTVADAAENTPEALAIKRENVEVAARILQDDDLLRAYFVDEKRQIEIAKDRGCSQVLVSRAIAKRVRSARKALGAD